jgi:hypothetical protein
VKRPEDQYSICDIIIITSRSSTPPLVYTISRSTCIFSSRIDAASSLVSVDVMLAAMTARLTPHARPSATLLSTNTYGTFLSSDSIGRWSRIASGVVSAAGCQYTTRRRRGEGARTCGQDDDLGDAAVQRLGDLVGALLELVVVRGLLDEVEDGGG